ncbi:ABC transporter substrate-binding protein [Parasphaerochaeta coccoides]|uniref:sn-glycerol-3-phosphate-binding periplasmic protein UgpB n=1 Tax=Parasphaerochaeta coccoides (strain ATCC BAA-1237 / DSM 17374 / SPN1) TaxID=760011 RepID=F4GHJ8_PARC1|nr:sugar ABC transporter substrate-binding protein [Parasphaerochaeta coccoides]AEC02587.1 carbohydrate ABC transporter substrate-binding protein, CUT1 family [Parasphaerochaeta coccoides DSM 17374]
MKKITMIVLAIVCTAGILMAGGAKESQTSSSRTTIKVSTWDLSSNPSVSNAVAAFEAKNPDIKVELMDIPSTEYTQKLSIMLNGGSDLDAFFIKDADTTKSLFDKGQLADMRPYIAADSFDIEGFNGLTKNFTMPNGAVVGLPVRSDWYVMYYNKDIFDAAGIAYPGNDWTWTEFEQLAKRLTSGSGATKVYGALLHTWQACVQNWGVQDGKHTIMDSDYSFFKPYYEMALRMQNEDKTLMDYATLKTSNIHYSSAFLTGRVAMMPMGTWFITTAIDKVKIGESSVRWGIVTLPHAEDVPQGYTVGSATPVSMNQASSKKDAAWKFISFMTGEEGASEYAKAGAFPGRNNEKTLSSIASLNGMPEGALHALQVTNISFDRPGVDKVAEINAMLGEEHSMIMLGEVSINEGLSTMSARNKEILR